MPDDAALLRRYADEKSETAFAELVRRHLDLVYSAALRRLGGDAHAAADIAQQVFTTLARDAQKLSPHAVLTAWLYTATRHAAIDRIRAESRRAAREQEATAMQTLAAPEADWNKLRPVLDDVMDELPDADRTAVLLRFFEQRPFAEIGATLALSEDAARMRVDRALEKLRALLARRGVTSTASALAAVLANQAVASAPAGLTAIVTSSALAAGGSAGTLGLLGFMSTTKTITGLASVVALCAIGTAVFEQRERQAAASALADAERQRASLQASVAKLEKQTRQSDAALAAAQKELAALRANASSAAQPVTQPALPGARMVNALSASPVDYALEHPDKRAAYIDQEVLRARARFERFFRETQLSPEQQELFLKNLREYAEQKLDFLGAVRAYGYNPQNLPADNASVASMGRLEKQIPLDLQSHMRALLGDAGFQQYQQYTRTLPLRNTVSDLASRLYDTDAPLTPVQAQQLTDLMAQNPYRTPVAGFRGNTVADTFIPVSVYNGAKTQLNMQGGSTLTDWHEPVSDAAVTQAAGVLTPAQLAALRQVQEQQAAQLLGAPNGPDIAKPIPGAQPAPGK